MWNEEKEDEKKGNFSILSWIVYKKNVDILSVTQNLKTFDSKYTQKYITHSITRPYVCQSKDRIIHKKSFFLSNFNKNGSKKIFVMLFCSVNQIQLKPSNKIIIVEDASKRKEIKKFFFYKFKSNFSEMKSIWCYYALSLLVLHHFFLFLTTWNFLFFLSAR